MAEESRTPGKQEQVACSVCIAEVPRDEALSMESRDYVIYFCGLDCYHQWSAEEREEGTGSPE
ncbi:MAG TPA: DUF3330 domain-containing protein [Gammaproteobacteria bacterium]|nr:DUF3330 domain-containing protein [Gammaproteobacteria bacterium]